MRRLAPGAVALGLLLVAAPAHAASSPEAQLAAKYAPVLSLEPQRVPCGDGEAYRPTSVEIVLGRAGVVLRDAHDKPVAQAPTAHDLWGLGGGYHLDLPGDPLQPGCGYERDFRAWNDGRAPMVYARVATDASRPGKLAVEYWLYYTFNDFTDKHEGDWEMAQVDFEASDAAEALREDPYEVDLSQHAGGERATWGDDKLERQGTHPVIYDATGSHANYFGRALYLGRGDREGFGCDDTRNATARVPLQAVLLPEIPSSPADRFAWLAFGGRWGQKEAGINNGPKGPAVKGRWSEPIVWSEGLRTTSVEVPGALPFSIDVGGIFCGGVTGGAVALNWALVHPTPFLVLVALLACCPLVAARRTAWGPPDPRPLRRRRRGGQILRASTRVYLEDIGTFAGMGAIFVPISVVAAGLQWVLFHVTGLESYVALDGRHGAVTAFFALALGGVAAAFSSVVTTAAVAAALAELDAGRRIDAMEAYRRAFGRLRSLFGGLAREIGAVLVLSVTTIGIPFAIHRFIRWSLFAQACVLEDRSARGALRRSSQLVGGRWWRTFGFTAMVDVLAALSGPIVGLALLLVTDRTLEFINVASSAVYALTVPYAAIALTLYYFDLEARDPSRPALRA